MQLAVVRDGIVRRRFNEEHGELGGVSGCLIVNRQSSIVNSSAASRDTRDRPPRAEQQ